eukprot:GDKI01037540.1.p2 GENE.GDKI01037540.1~~GDKI01037540.1.p2  ORF type:complete len:114 (+),score=30.04 GDKI01037540.1:1-342(+)
MGGRRDLFRIALKDVLTGDDVQWDELVKLTEGYSGADIASVCRDAAMMELRNRMKKAREQGLTAAQVMQMKDEFNRVPIMHRDFLDALKNVNRSVAQTDLETYDKWLQEFGAK